MPPLELVAEALHRAVKVLPAKVRVTDVASTSETPPLIAISETTNVPPLRSDRDVPLALRTLVTAAHNRSSRRLVVDPHDVQARNQPEFFVACRCESLKYAGHVMTVFFTSFPVNASAISSNFVGPIDEVSSGVNSHVSLLNSTWISRLSP